MSAFIQTLRSAAHRRATYRRTVRELRAMPRDVAIDLDMDPAEADRIARRAVYEQA